MIEAVKIQGYKSIRDLSLKLNRLNVLIGSNGVGKSNFISFFELSRAIYQQHFGRYTMDSGGIDRLLYRGRKETRQILGFLDFDNTNAFEFVLSPSMNSSGKGYIRTSRDYFNSHRSTDKDYENWNIKEWDNNVEESDIIKNKKWRAAYLKKYLGSFIVYHFHDTSSTSPMRRSCNINDNYQLRENGENLAAYLYRLQQTDKLSFDLIEDTVRSVAPYFDRFDLKANRYDSNTISLEWLEKGSDMYLDGFSFSDGTLRFIALATLLLQSELPEVVIIDEPELGLHPAAIEKFAAIVEMASNKSQIILSTQSVNLVNYFNPEDVIVVDRENGQTVFKHLDTERLKVWMDDYNYSLSDLWEKNLIGGQL